MPSLDDFAQQKLGDAGRGATCAARWPRPSREDGIWVERNGRRLLSFSCNDYLGLSQHPAIKAAAIAAIERHGVGAGASRLVTGNHPLYAELEARLARLKEHRGGLRVRLRLSRQCRHRPGADRRATTSC